MDAFIGEIRMFGGNFAPHSWMFCNGQILSIAEYQALFALLGTTYGGDGVSTFALPDLRGRVPVHQGQSPGLSNYPMGQRTGSETVTLSINQIPGHTHVPNCDGTGATAGDPTNAFWGNFQAAYTAATGINTVMNPKADSIAGGSQPHDNMLPYQAVSFIIAVEGLFPSRN